MTDSLRSNLEVELGGALVGYYCQDSSGRRFTQITGFIPAHHGIERGGTFTFTPDSWSQIIRDQETRGKGEEILGWVHSHPSYGYPPDPSGYDEFIMKHFFNEPERLTLILDLLGIKLTDRTKTRLYETLSITPDDLVNEVMEIVVTTKGDDVLQRRLEESIKITEEELPETPVITVTSEDVETATPQPSVFAEPQIKITNEDIDPLIKEGEETRKAFEDLEEMARRGGQR